MESFRPVWKLHEPVPSMVLQSSVPEVGQLLALECSAKLQTEEALRAARLLFQEESVDGVLSLITAANIDMVAGCELARAGYFKQAYSLWRGWFEEMLLAIYFLESPLHRTAWRSVEVLGKSGDRPALQLMLHQMLIEKGDKAHPFGVAYSERFDKLASALRINMKGNKHPLKIAEHRLTDLSQGVHGTYQPRALKSKEELAGAMSRHILPVFKESVQLVGLFWFICIQAQIDMSDQDLLNMRNSNAVPEGATSSHQILVPLLPQLRLALDDLMKG